MESAPAIVGSIVVRLKLLMGDESGVSRLAEAIRHTGGVEDDEEIGVRLYAIQAANVLPLVD